MSRRAELTADGIVEMVLCSLRRASPQNAFDIRENLRLYTSAEMDLWASRYANECPGIHLADEKEHPVRIMGHKCTIDPSLEGIACYFKRIGLP